ncbi:MAG: leucyl aminopeptidase [Firmicutes bacterium]|nr:leucyl aminopeptidase [Bacillota bacterium]
MIKIQQNYESKINIYPLFKNNLILEKTQGILNNLINKDLFTGEKNTLFHTSTHLGNELVHHIFIGLGDSSDNYMEILRSGIANACKKANTLKEKDVVIQVPNSIINGEALENISTAITLSTYSFNKYQSKKKDSTIEEYILVGNGLDNFKKNIDEGVLLGEMTILSRELANEPGDVINPETLAVSAISLGDSSGFKVDVYDRKKIEKLRMNAFLAVSNGSSYEPQLIVMEYMGNQGGEVLGLVGKGITFDSGGLSLKPANSMLTMQGDMSGASSVIAAMGAIASMKLPVNVIAVVAACDNSVSSRSYRPNDILTSRSGKTIFITNTDAEGRLTLIDALDYILTEKNVDKVVDIATLTGAAEVALGQKIAAVITNNDEFMNELNNAANDTGERVWELPHDDDFMKLIETPYADLNNSGGRFAGTITAGLFLGSVVGNTPWLHIDIAGPSWSEDSDGYFSKGATGFGTRLLYKLVKNTILI